MHCPTYFYNMKPEFHGLYDGPPWTPGLEYQYSIERFDQKRVLIRNSHRDSVERNIAKVISKKEINVC